MKIRLTGRALLGATWLLAGLPAAAQLPAPVLLQPKGEQVEFALIQERCVQSGEVLFGAGQRWSACRVTRAGFVTTIGLLDFYYAHYCLVGPVSGKNACDKQAQVIFGNRAYRSEAYTVLQRIDPAGTQYEVPLVTGFGDDNLLVLSAMLKKGAAPVRKFYSWRDALWQSVDQNEWKSALLRRLPHGSRITSSGSVDPLTFSVRVTVAQSADRGGGKPLRVDLGFTDGHFFVRDVLGGIPGQAAHSR